MLKRRMVSFFLFLVLSILPRPAASERKKRTHKHTTGENTASHIVFNLAPAPAAYIPFHSFRGRKRVFIAKMRRKNLETKEQKADTYTNTQWKVADGTHATHTLKTNLYYISVVSLCVFFPSSSLLLFPYCIIKITNSLVPKCQRKKKLLGYCHKLHPLLICNERQRTKI